MSRWLKPPGGFLVLIEPQTSREDLIQLVISYIHIWRSWYILIENLSDRSRISLITMKKPISEGLYENIFSLSDNIFKMNNVKIMAQKFNINWIWAGIVNRRLIKYIWQCWPMSAQSLPITCSRDFCLSLVNDRGSCIRCSCNFCCGCIWFAPSVATSVGDPVFSFVSASSSFGASALCFSIYLCFIYPPQMNVKAAVIFIITCESILDGGTVYLVKEIRLARSPAWDKIYRNWMLESDCLVGRALLTLQVCPFNEFGLLWVW